MPPRQAAARRGAEPLRAALVAAGRRLGARGLIAAGEGNISVWVGNDLLITPAGRRKDELVPDDIVTVRMRGADAASAASVSGQPASSDLAIHRAVYRARPDVLAVAHAHLPAAMALTLAGQVPDPAVLPETAALLPILPFVEFGEPGSDELAERVAAALAKVAASLPGAAVLERHGAVAVGQGDGDPVAAIEQAINRLELVEVLCRTWRDALLVRAAASAVDAPGYPSRAGPPPRVGSRDRQEEDVSIRALVAEAVGTFILVAVGSLGVATVWIITQGEGSQLIASLIVPFSFGFGLLAAIAIGGHASGGHFNPAVTLAALFDGRITWQSALGYVVAQIIGALGASLAILLVTSDAVVAMSVNQPGPTAADPFTAELHAFSTEIILTAIFVAVILTVTRNQSEFGVLVIPFTLVAIHYVGMHISGASVNPVRSLAPAVVSGQYASLWVYLTAPFAGSVVGWAIYRFLTPPDDEVSVEIDEDFDDEDLEDDDDDEDEDDQDVTR